MGWGGVWAVGGEDGEGGWGGEGGEGGGGVGCLEGMGDEVLIRWETGIFKKKKIGARKGLCLELKAHLYRFKHPAASASLS